MTARRLRAVRSRKTRRWAYMEKGAPRRPLFDGRGQLSVSCRPSSSRPWLSLPLSVIPPFIWVYLREVLTSPSVAAAWHAHPMPALFASGHLPRSYALGGRGQGILKLNREGGSSASSYQI